MAILRGHPLALTSVVILAGGFTAGGLLLFSTGVPPLTTAYIAAVNKSRVNWHIEMAPSSATPLISLSSAESAAEKGPFGWQASVVRAGLVVLTDELAPRGQLAWSVFLDPPGNHVVEEGSARLVPANSPVPPAITMTTGTLNFYVEIVSADNGALLQAGEGSSPALPSLPQS
jgi:hypothetical protein